MILYKFSLQSRVIIIFHSYSSHCSTTKSNLGIQKAGYWLLINCVYFFLFFSRVNWNMNYKMMTALYLYQLFMAVEARYSWLRTKLHSSGDSTRIKGALKRNYVSQRSSLN